MKKFIIIFLLVSPLLFSIQKGKETEKTKSVSKIQRMQKKDSVVKDTCGKRVFNGYASYYGEKWNGRRTANMEIFDCNSLTCASPTLPFNTLLKVTNLDNNKSINIRVNDRGPYKMNSSGKALRPLIPHPTRVLDLSKASFAKIANLKKGVIKIKYEILGNEYNKKTSL